MPPCLSLFTPPKDTHAPSPWNIHLLVQHVFLECLLVAGLYIWFWTLATNEHLPSPCHAWMMTHRDLWCHRRWLMTLWNGVLWFWCGVWVLSRVWTWQATPLWLLWLSKTAIWGKVIPGRGMQRPFHYRSFKVSLLKPNETIRDESGVIVLLSNLCNKTCSSW